MGLSLYGRVRDIIEGARRSAARSVNTALVISNWLVGREIVREEQRGCKRAAYGAGVLHKLSVKLTAEFGPGYSVPNLSYFRQFTILYPELMAEKQIHHALRDESTLQAGPSAARPGTLNPDLSWTHYRTLLRIQNARARSFYEIETARNAWSARELERQVNSLLYERLAMSKDKAGLMKLARQGQEIRRPEDAIKDPMVIEFLGLPESPAASESSLEGALIGNLRQFLLELGKGFAFVARQERLSLDGDHFYVDLVFYHAVLKRYVLIDLKVGKLTHQDLGQMQLYVNYYDAERRSRGDKPTLGLILCTDKNDAVVRYTLGGGRRKIFASRYKLYLPTEAELAAELRREMSAYQAGGAQS